MIFYADLHIHSKYSRATGKYCDLKHLAYWARKKGIAVIGTGDFTHPAWQAELKEQLVPAEPGLFRLRPALEKEVIQMLPPACQGATRFLLSVEISTIYKKGDKTRKIHHLLYAPHFAVVERMTEQLSRIGNVQSDGRPILGLDARHLLEITLESDPGSYLVPAHIWTPWFAALGSKSGFDAIDECYADLAPHIFAVETGLSSDPEMNWRVSSLDRFRLVSNSDAHSPEKLGREACVFDTELDYFSIRRALETGQGYQGTVEFFPEEGKYHLDGHRNCQVRLLPHQTRQLEGRCPACGKPLTVGVMHRVDDLADRAAGTRPETAGAVQSLVPLPELLSEILHVGPKSKKVGQHYEGLLNKLGPELSLINDVPLEEIRRSGDELVAEAISRLRTQEVIREAGYDGVYGTIRLFREEELRQKTNGASLFTQEPPLQTKQENGPPDTQAAGRLQQEKTARQQVGAPQTPTGTVSPAPSDDTVVAASADILAGLDRDQRRAAEMTAGPLLVVAGPGSGKTRTLTHRIAHLIRNHHVDPEHCLAITFTRRAADEMRERLRSLLPAVAEALPLFTFHALGMSILQEHWNAAGLQRGFRVVSDMERHDLLHETLGVPARQTRSVLLTIAVAKRTGQEPAEATQADIYHRYQRELDTRNLVDFDDLIGRTIQAFEADTSLRDAYRERYRWVCIDEYQDVDEQQVRLIKLLVPSDGNICAIGDPDQAIYRFRGADVRFFARFTTDFPGTRVVRLTRNYRSDRNLVSFSSQVIAPSGSKQQSTPVLAHPPSLITIHEGRTEKAEAEFVVQSIETLLGGHSFFSIDSGRSRNAEDRALSFADIAILYRTEAQAGVAIEALHRSGMPFQQYAHTRLLDHPGVVLLIDALREQPGDGALVARLESSCEKAEARGRAETRAALGLLQPVAWECGDDLDRFLSTLALETQIDTRNPRADRISLLTLHAAKGLEFPVVFIIGCEDGILPLTWGEAEAADLEEERRLFYVGVTRAKTKLYLCYARKRRWRGVVHSLPPSPYLAGVEEHLLERCRSQVRGRGKKADQLALF